MKKIKSLAILMCFVMFFSCAGVGAQDGYTKEQISDIKVKGNSSVSTSTILNKLKIQPGDMFVESALNKELKRLYAMGYFTDVYIDTEQRPEGVVVIITVVEKPLIDNIEFKGNKRINARKLRKEIALEEGELVDYNDLGQAVNSIRAFYTKEGYSNVSVDYSVETDPATGGATVVFTIDEGAPVKISAIKFEGNEHIKAAELQKYMSTKKAFWFIQKGAFDEDKFQGDLDRIKSVYRSKGYLDASATYREEYTDDGKRLTLIIMITEGKLYKIGDFSVEGQLAFPKDQITSLMKIKTGDPFDYAKIKEDIEAIRSFYYDKGYMNAEVDLQHKYNAATGSMDLLFKINAGEEVYVGKVNVIGNTKTKDKVIRREIRLYPGEMYNGEALKKSKERIYNLGFFEDVYFETVPTADPNVKDLNVTVKETKTGEFSFGGGYSSVDAFIGFVQISQRNFDITNFPYFQGGGQSLVIRGEIGSSRQNYYLSWTDPWIFDFPYLFGFDVYRQEQNRSGRSGYGYDDTRTGGSLRFGKELTDEIYTGLVYNLEEVKISNVPDNATEALRKEVGTNWVSKLTADITYDTRDNKYSPKSGWVTGLSLTNAGGFIGGDKDFLKAFGYATYYHSFWDKNLTLELKVRGGGCEAYANTDEVPIYERFFAGGGATIRGYKERGVGPRDRGTNAALGGEALFIANAELTFPIFKNLMKGAIFYDAGDVWDLSKTPGAKYSNGVKMGAGLGVRVKTPIGPVKLDYGYPLSDNFDDKKEGEFYFSVSHGF